MHIMIYMDFSILVGKTITDIQKSSDKEEEALTFTLDSGEKYMMMHQQDCCESVYIEDICGDLKDLLSSPVLRASEDCNSEDKSLDSYDEDFLWTFYNIATAKGHVTIRWYGTSNGYYSVGVDFFQVEEDA